MHSTSRIPDSSAQTLCQTIPIQTAPGAEIPIIYYRRSSNLSLPSWIRECCSTNVLLLWMRYSPYYLLVGDVWLQHSGQSPASRNVSNNRLLGSQEPGVACQLKIKLASVGFYEHLLTSQALLTTGFSFDHQGLMTGYLPIFDLRLIPLHQPEQLFNIAVWLRICAASTVWAQPNFAL